MVRSPSSGRTRPEERLSPNCLVVVIASDNTSSRRQIEGILKDEQFEIVDGSELDTNLSEGDTRRPPAYLVQVDRDPALASQSVASLRSMNPDTPILFAVDENSDQLELSVRRVGVQYYMLLPAERDELVIVAHSLATA